MKFQSDPIAEHEEAPLADDGRWEDLVAHWANRHTKTAEDGRNASYVVSVTRPQDPSGRAQLEEIASLVQAQGDRVAGSEILVLRKVEPRTLLGKGACADVARRASECGADLLV